MKIWGSNTGFIEFQLSQYATFIFQNLLPFEHAFLLVFFNILRISGYRFLYIFCQFIPICFNIFAINMGLFCMFVCLRQGLLCSPDRTGTLCKPGCLQAHRDTSTCPCLLGARIKGLCQCYFLNLTFILFIVIYKIYFLFGNLVSLFSLFNFYLFYGFLKMSVHIIKSSVKQVFSSFQLGYFSLYCLVVLTTIPQVSQN